MKMEKLILRNIFHGKVNEMKQYPFGIFDDDTMEGLHTKLGKLRKEIILEYVDDGERVIGYERYFFDIDKTNGYGIDQYNVESYFYRKD